MTLLPHQQAAVNFFNARGMSILTEDDYLAQIEDLKKQLAESQDNCRTLARRLKAIAEART